jgi:hypothetical protein
MIRSKSIENHRMMATCKNLAGLLPESSAPRSGAAAEPQPRTLEPTDRRVGVKIRHTKVL